MSTARFLRVAPARDPAEAARRFAELTALDGPEIAATGRSRLYAHATRTTLAVVLLHGYTNAPEQWARFASELHARGHAVVIPRLPGHGREDRRTTDLARVTRSDYLATANAAVDIARGCGESVAIAGLSLGGALAVRLAQLRADVARTVAIVPLFGVFTVGAAADSALAAILRSVPDVAVPWDPSGNPKSTPPHAYPCLSTRGLGVAMRLGLDVYERARALVPNGRSVFVLNAHEPAIDNALARAVADRFERSRAGASDLVVLRDLPKNHDIIDPTNENQRIAEVYPIIRRLLEGERV